MANDQQFCLRWNNHQSTLISVFDSLLENGTLVDCTLAAEGQYLKAHKVVLSACSPYLETLLSQHYEKHPIVILKDVKFSELKSMMDYMYRGEVNISQDQLGTFLKAAESLQIKGLSDNGDDARDVGSTAKKPDAPRPSVTQTRAPLESKRPAPIGDLSDTSRDGSISPSSLRKRRRTRRPSQGDDPDSNLDNNVCDLPAAQSTPMPVPSAAPVQSLPKQIVKTEPPPPMPDPVKKEILDPPAEALLEPKTEYLDYMNNENSIEVEDLTLDDDDEEGLDSSMDASRPGPSHGDLSQQGGYPPWTLTGDQSGTDEIFMAAQEAVGAAAGQQQRDSQENENEKPVERRKSSRPRMKSETYISVECRHRSPKSRKRVKKPPVMEIKQEPEDEDPILGPMSSGQSKSPSPVYQKTPKKNSKGRKKRTKRSPNEQIGFQQIKIEPLDEPSTSFQSASDLPSISDELEYIKKSIKTENQEQNLPYQSAPKKRGKKISFPPSLGHKCEFCGRIYKYRKGMLQHQRLECNQEPQFPCPYCPLRFRYRHQIRNHVYNEHNQAFKRWYSLFYQSSKLTRWHEKEKQNE